MAERSKSGGRSFIEQWYGADSAGASVERDYRSGNVRVIGPGAPSSPPSPPAAKSAKPVRGPKPKTGRTAAIGDNVPSDLKAQWKAAEKLQAVAERTISDAQKVYDQPRLMNTARRARLGSGVMEQQQARIAHAKTAMRIAEALREGSAAPELTKVQSLSDVERLQYAYRQAMYSANRAEKKPYSGSMVGHEPTPAHIAHAKPNTNVLAHVFRDDAEMLARAFAGDKKLSKDVAIIRKAAENVGGSFRFTDERSIQAFERVGKAVKERLPKSGKPDWAKYDWQAKRLHSTVNGWLGSIREYRADQRLGLADTKSLQTMLRSYAEVRINRPGADPVKAAERSLIGLKLPGFFPTPDPLAKRMADLAGIAPGHRVLEPSAGTGRLADVAKSRGAAVDTVEMQSKLRDVLTTKGHNLVHHDFTSMPTAPKYDRILMNPPFEKGQDMAHVKRAYEMLKPGGKMVAVMGEGAFSRSDKTATGFREWLGTVGGAHEKLPPNSFKESNTGVNTRLVTIEKPHAMETAAVRAPVSTALPRPAVVPRPANGGVTTALERALATSAKRAASGGGKLGLALAVVGAGATALGLLARPSTAAAKPSSGPTFERRYVRGPKTGKTETVRKVA